MWNPPPKILSAHCSALWDKWPLRDGVLGLGLGGNNFFYLDVTKAYPLYTRHVNEGLLWDPCQSFCFFFYHFKICHEVGTHRSFYSHYRIWHSRHDLCVQSVVRLYICMNVGIDGSSFFKGPQCLLNSTRLVDSRGCQAACPWVCLIACSVLSGDYIARLVIHNLSLTIAQVGSGVTLLATVKVL